MKYFIKCIEKIPQDVPYRLFSWSCCDCLGYLAQ